MGQMHPPYSFINSIGFLYSIFYYDYFFFLFFFFYFFLFLGSDFFQELGYIFQMPAYPGIWVDSDQRLDSTGDTVRM